MRQIVNVPRIEDEIEQAWQKWRNSDEICRPAEGDDIEEKWRRIFAAGFREARTVMVDRSPALPLKQWLP